MLRRIKSEVSHHGPITRLRMQVVVLGHAAHEVSVYRVGRILVEAGALNTSEIVTNFLRMHPVDKVITTHHHEDHSGAGSVIIEQFGIPVCTPEGAVPILSDGPRVPLYRQIIYAVPRPFDAYVLPEKVEAGDYTFEVIPTPGHAFDHVCFFEPEKKWLFSGDLYVHETMPVLRRIENVWEHVRSLEKVLALEPELIICSHAGFVEDAQAALQRKIDFYEGLASRADELRRRGLTSRDITRELLGNEGLFTYFSLGEYSKKRLIEDLLDGG